jgi:hypothetical protein
VIDEFQDLVGVTPTAYLRQRSDGATHLRPDDSASRPRARADRRRPG